MNSPGEMAPERAERALRRVRRLARVLDDSIPIPGTGWRIGIDPLIGVLPVVGDVVGSALALWVVAEAYRLEVPSGKLGRMVANLGAEAVGGSIPLAGDLFDAGWKANLRNVRLIEAHLEGAITQRRELDSGERWRRVALVVATIGVVVGAAALSVLALGALASLLGIG